MSITNKYSFGKTNGFAAESSTHGTIQYMYRDTVFSSGRELNSKIYFDKRAMWDSWVKNSLSVHLCRTNIRQTLSNYKMAPLIYEEANIRVFV